MPNFNFIQPYHDVIRIASFTDSAVPATLAMTQNKPMFLGSLKVPAGQALEIGFGQKYGLDDASGRIYADINDSADADMNGKLRISIWDEEDRPVDIVGTWDLAQLRQTTYNQRMPLPECGKMVTEDKKIVLELICYDSGKTFKSSGSDMLISCTKYKVIK